MGGRPVGNGLRLALTTLTVLRVREPQRLDRPTAGAAMSLAPAVGLLVGGIAAAVLLGLREVTTGDLLPAVAALAVLAALTRGLHLDLPHRLAHLGLPVTRVQAVTTTHL